MAKVNLDVNGVNHQLDVSPDMPLLWAIRDFIGLTGTKYSCGIAQCGACTVHVDGNPVRSCITSVSSVESRKILTIEGLSDGNDHPVQKAWIEEQVPQCGYCQSGQIMAAAALLDKNPKPSVEEVEVAMKGMICRCGTYPRIKKAIARASAEIS